MRRGFALATIGFALSALAQKPCAVPEAALRELPGARVIRTVCDVRAKESQRTTSIAWIVSYETGAAAEVRFVGDQVVDVRRLAGQPQSSEEERQEAEAIVRRAFRTDLSYGIEGGFVVPPPAGSPAGRYLEMHAVSPDRKRIIAEIIVDLSRRKIAAERMAP